MNFFEHQEQARKRTGRLVALFILAILALISLTSLVLLAFFNEGDLAFLQGEMSSGDWMLLINVSLTVLLIVAFASLFKHLQLKGGGKVVAEALGGRLVNPNTRDPEERRLINLVEEMALASGTPVPPVYLLEEAAINAFAAGYSSQDAVIGVTRGAVQQLNRDELQGVIAHEFSHIFNGDMRLNLRLVAILHGIVIIGLGGRLLMHAASVSRFRRTSRDGRATMAMLALGLALLVLGAIGIFFGKLIKAAVSRQREFLADASAVQFTRNPQGIAGALSKIGGLPQHSTLEAGQSEQFSHLFFSNALGSSLKGMLATHPPLQERIERLNAGPLPQASANKPAPSQPSPATEPTRGFAGLKTGLGVAAAAAERSIEAMGQPDEQHLEQAHQTLMHLDPRLVEAAHEPFSARAIIYDLLLSEDAQVRETQLNQLQAEAARDSYLALQELLEPLSQVTGEQRLPLVEISLPALKYLTEEQLQRFKSCMALLIRADQRLSLMEWSLSRLVLHSLEKPEPRPRKQNLDQLGAEAAELLSLIAWAGQQGSGKAHLSAAEKHLAAQACFAAASQELPFAQMELQAAEDLKLRRLDPLLKAFNGLKPLHKPRLLKAVARCITEDGQISLQQAELFRVLGAALDSPLPPLLDGNSQRDT